MNINRQNYESILIDYLDGKLNSKQKDELMQFLSENKDIAAELDGLSEVILPVHEASFPNKPQLKKLPMPLQGIGNQTDYLCIAELEDDLNDNEKILLAELLANDKKVKNVKKIFTHTRLAVPYEIVYPNKLELKRIHVPLFHRTSVKVSIGIAATAALIIALNIFLETIYSPSITSKPDSPAVTAATNISPSTTRKTDLPVKTSTKRIIRTEKITATATSPKIQVNENTDDQHPTETKIEKIQPIAVQLTPSGVSHTKLGLPQGNVDIALNKQQLSNQPIKQHGTTKEYSLSGLLQKGLKHIGIEYNIQRSDEGRVEKISVDSELLSFSTTRNKNDE